MPYFVRGTNAQKKDIPSVFVCVYRYSVSSFFSSPPSPLFSFSYQQSHCSEGITIVIKARRKRVHFETKASQNPHQIPNLPQFLSSTHLIYPPVLPTPNQKNITNSRQYQVLDPQNSEPYGSNLPPFAQLKAPSEPTDLEQSSPLAFF